MSQHGSKAGGTVPCRAELDADRASDCAEGHSEGSTARRRTQAPAHRSEGQQGPDLVSPCHSQAAVSQAACPFPLRQALVGTWQARSAPHWHVLSSWFILVVSSWDPLVTGGPQGGSLTCRLPPWPGRGPQGRSRLSAGSWCGLRCCGLRCCSPAPSAGERGCRSGEKAQRQPQAAVSPIPSAPGLTEGPNPLSQSSPSAAGESGELLAVPT